MPIEEALVNQWKKQYRKVYTMSFRDVDYAFREITIGEYDKARLIEEEISPVDAEDYLVEMALLNNRDKIDKIPAGFVSALADEILYVSGFTSPKVAKGILLSERAAASQMYPQMKTYILATMPAYKEEDLDQLSFRQLCYKLGIAESIIRLNQIAFGGQNDVTFDIQDPEEIAAQQAAEEKAKKDRQEKAWALLGKKGYIPESDEKAPPVAPSVKPEDPIAAKLREALGG